MVSEVIKLHNDLRTHPRGVDSDFLTFLGLEVFEEDYKR